MFDVGVTIKQPLYTAGKVRTAVKLAEESLEEKKASWETARQMVTFKVFEAFHDVLLAQANQGVVNENYQQRVKHLEQARIRFKNGVATEIDVLRSEVDVANLEPLLIRAENRIRLARAVLNNLIVEDLEAPTQISGSLEHRPWPVDSLEEIQRRTLEQRPELQATRRQVSEARLMLKLAHAEKKLSVDLDAHYGYTMRDIRNVFDTSFARWNFTFNFKLPIIDSGRTSGLVAQAVSRLRASEQTLAQLENNVKLEVKQAYDDMQSSAKAIAAARLSVTQAEKVLVMMQANYQYGAATTLDVTDSQTALTLARNSQVNATYDYEMAKARLRLASGSAILDQEVNP
jgi:HAE1 family hydrophobic/amphiphilic exporter-1